MFQFLGIKTVLHKMFEMNCKHWPKTSQALHFDVATLFFCGIIVKWGILYFFFIHISAHSFFADCHLLAGPDSWPRCFRAFAANKIRISWRDKVLSECMGNYTTLRNANKLSRAENVWKTKIKPKIECKCECIFVGQNQNQNADLKM